MELAQTDARHLPTKHAGAAGSIKERARRQHAEQTLEQAIWPSGGAVLALRYETESERGSECDATDWSVRDGGDANERGGKDAENASERGCRDPNPRPGRWIAVRDEGLVADETCRHHDAQQCSGQQQRGIGVDQHLLKLTYRRSAASQTPTSGVFSGDLTRSVAQTKTLAVNTPNARVLAFIASYAAAWRSVRSEFDDDAAAAPGKWAEAQRELEDAHFIEGSRAGADDDCSRLAPSHVPGKERIAETHIDGDNACITTLCDATYWTYDLISIDEDWRIKGLKSSRQKPRSAKGSPPLFSEEERSSFLASAHFDAELCDPKAGDIRAQGDLLFSDGRSVTNAAGETTTIQVRSLGNFVTKSGVLAAADVTSLPEALAPFVRKVEPGAYPAEYAFAYHAVIALRIRFDPSRPTVHWRSADTTNGSSAVGVDGGNVGIFDVGAMLSIDQHDLEESIWRKCEPLDEDGPAIALELVQNADLMVVLSGYGDGVYPCFWGTDAAGVVTTLQIEFVDMAISRGDD